MPSKEELSIVKPEVLKITEDASKVVGKSIEQVRARSGTWGAATVSKQKEPAKVLKSKDKDVRRYSDDRRQKRGE